MIALLLGAIGCAAAAYQALALVAVVVHARRRPPVASKSLPPVSMLKPIYGADEAFADAIRSHAVQDYPEFEILFGVRDPHDSAVPYIEQLQRDFPRISIRIVPCRTSAPNAKVGSLIDLACEARFPVLVVNDSDIKVEPTYLRRIVAELHQPEVGLVTCLYRASGSSWAAELEALGIATDFAPSAMLAPMLRVNEFGLGSTLLFRREQLSHIGGFESVRDFLADDYQIGKRISDSGKRVRLSSVPVETHLGSGTWKQVWQHQVRWARTIRVSRPGGYVGLFITNGTVWSLVALAGGWPALAIVIIVLRVVVGLAAGVAVLKDPLTAKLWWLMPVRDLFGFAVWIAGLAGKTVVWRGQRLTLGPHGTLPEG